jgi:hypothetical protein
VHKSEKIRDGQASKEVHPPVEAGIDFCDASVILTFPVMQASPKAYNPIHVVYNYFYQLCPMKFALRN